DHGLALDHHPDAALAAEAGDVRVGVLDGAGLVNDGARRLRRRAELRDVAGVVGAHGVLRARELAAQRIELLARDRLDLPDTGISSDAPRLLEGNQAAAHVGVRERGAVALGEGPAAGDLVVVRRAHGST